MNRKGKGLLGNVVNSAIQNIPMAGKIKDLKLLSKGISLAKKGIDIL